MRDRKKGGPGRSDQTDEPATVRKPRRSRRLTPEEETLWDAVARSAKPLKPRRTPRTAPGVLSQDDDQPLRVKPVPTPVVATPVVASVRKPPPLAPLARRERSRLSRGQREIDARLDLHGMTQERAFTVLSNFLFTAQGRGHSLVLVITGKGRTPHAERGVLRRQVPQWLALGEFRSLVIGFEEAHVTHGGEGALYVRIRRPR